MALMNQIRVLTKSHRVEHFSFASALALLAFLTALPCAAQSAQEILQTTLERYEERMEGVENYTVVYENGMALYYEREIMDDHPVYRPALAGLPEKLRSRATGSPNAYTVFNEIASRSRLAGTETVEGRRAYVIEADGLQGTDLWAAPEEAGEFEPRTATFWIDAEHYVPLKMILEGTADTQGERRPVTLEAHMSDYREVEGVLHPFHTSMAFEGLLSGEQQQQMSEAMAKLRKQLEQMPPAQREQMKRMMGGKLADMMGGGGAMTLNMGVKELRVNAGPPQ